MKFLLLIVIKYTLKQVPWMPRWQLHLASRTMRMITGLMWIGFFPVCPWENDKFRPGNSLIQPLSENLRTSIITQNSVLISGDCRVDISENQTQISMCGLMYYKTSWIHSLMWKLGPLLVKNETLNLGMDTSVIGHRGNRQSWADKSLLPSHPFSHPFGSSFPSSIWD